MCWCRGIHQKTGFIINLDITYNTHFTYFIWTSGVEICLYVSSVTEGGGGGSYLRDGREGRSLNNCTHVTSHPPIISFISAWYCCNHVLVLLYTCNATQWHPVFGRDTALIVPCRITSCNDLWNSTTTNVFLVINSIPSLVSHLHLHPSSICCVCIYIMLVAFCKWVQVEVFW